MTDTPDDRGFTLYYLRLQHALDDAIDAYEHFWSEVLREPLPSGDVVGVRYIGLLNRLEEKRATAVLLAAACVEGVANLYIRFRATPEQLPILERSTFLEKWTVIPSLFVPEYTLPKDAELYQDLRLLHVRRNAIAHLKEEVTRGTDTIHKASHPAMAGDEPVFIGRCRTLALRLIQHVATFDDTSDLTTIVLTLGLKPHTI